MKKTTIRFKIHTTLFIVVNSKKRAKFWRHLVKGRIVIDWYFQNFVQSEYMN